MRRASHSINKDSLLHIYQHIYPWRSLNEFVDQIKSTIAYKSEDNSLIALNKPFGVGTYKVLDENNKKQNADKVLYELIGSPRYCLSDALDAITKEFNSPKKYVIIKGIDRYMSGLTLIANNDQVINKFKRSINLCRHFKSPPYGLQAITNGYPIVSSINLKESVGMELIEVDEYGDYKEPIIHLNPGSTFRRKPHKKSFQAELIVKKINHELSVSLLELYTTNFMWDFPRCYISSKTAHILGDVRFSRRIREILGKKTQVSAFTSSGRFDGQHEPLSSKLRSVLGVEKNNQIPLMLDLKYLRLKEFNSKTKQDLIIESPYTPTHFAVTCQRLNLLGDSENVHNNENESESLRGV